MLFSTATPTPSVSPNNAGPGSVPPTLSTPAPSPLESSSATPIAFRADGLGESDLGVSEEGAPVFRIDQAVITGLKQNPAVLQTLEDLRRTKGVIIQISAEALPQIGPSFTWDWFDPNLNTVNGLSSF